MKALATLVFCLSLCLSANDKMNLYVFQNGMGFGPFEEATYVTLHFSILLVNILPVKSMKGSVARSSPS